MATRCCWNANPVNKCTEAKTYALASGNNALFGDDRRSLRFAVFFFLISALPPAMKTLSQLLGRIVLACGVALGLGVLGALAWANSENVAEPAVAVSTEAAR